MENIVEAEYTLIPERTLEVIAAEIRTIDNHVCQIALTGAIEIGKRLSEAKEQVGHGNWEKWCKENLDYSKSQAERFMRLSVEYGGKNSRHLEAISNPSTCTDLSISKALKLLRVPEDEIENFVEENNLADLTVKELEERIRVALEEKEGTQAELDKLQERYIQSTEAQKEKLREIEELNTKLEQLENQTPEADQEEAKEAVAELSKQLADLEANKAKLEKKNEKLKKDLEAAEEKQKQEIEATKQQATTKAYEIAMEASAEEMKQLKQETENALAAVELAEKKLAQSSNEDIVMFKAHINSLQSMFEIILTDIANVQEADNEQANKMRKATETVLLALQERVEQ